MSKIVRSSNKANLLFLNPPARVPVIRDYYCSKTSRSNYIFQPIDFIMQSGVLHKKYHLHFIDAIRDNLSERETIESVEMVNPQVIFFLAGAVNYPRDIEFVSKLSKPGLIFIGTGDIFLSEPKAWMEKYTFISAIVLDFTNYDIFNYLQGEYHLIRRMAYRNDQSDIVETYREDLPETIDIPIPRHELFVNKNYSFPFSKYRKFGVILTDFGCPFNCSFCVMASLPYRFRSKDTVLEELNYLHLLGIRELFWANQTFGIRKEETFQILSKMAEFSPLFSWTAFCRPDMVYESFITGMKKAGCHTIIFGVESGAEEILKIYKKGYTIDQAKLAFALCKRYNIRTVGTFILGLPGETEETIKQTISLSCEIGCDFASFHVAVPRSGTELRKEVLRTGGISPEDFSMDQSGSDINFVPEGLNRRVLLKLKKKAVLRFYLRPRFLLRSVLSIRSIYQGINMVRQALYLIMSNVGNKPVQKKEYKTK